MLYWTCFQSPVIPLLHHNLWTWKKVKKNNEAVVCLFPKHPFKYLLLPPRSAPGAAPEAASRPPRPPTRRGRLVASAGELLQSP